MLKHWLLDKWHTLVVLWRLVVHREQVVHALDEVQQAASSVAVVIAWPGGIVEDTRKERLADAVMLLARAEDRLLAVIAADRHGLGKDE